MEVIDRKYTDPVSFGGEHATWFFKSGMKYFIIDWSACPFDTGKPEAMAFKANKHGEVIDWNELAVSYSDNPTKAIQECVKQLRKKGVIYD